MRNVPLVAHIRRVLDERPGHSAPETRFLTELEDHLSEEEAERVFETVINWGRYAELFDRDSSGRFFIPEETPQPAGDEVGSR